MKDKTTSQGRQAFSYAARRLEGVVSKLATRPTIHEEIVMAATFAILPPEGMLAEMEQPGVREFVEEHGDPDAVLAMARKFRQYVIVKMQVNRDDSQAMRKALNRALKL